MNKSKSKNDRGNIDIKNPSIYEMEKKFKMIFISIEKKIEIKFLQTMNPRFYSNFKITIGVDFLNYFIKRKDKNDYLISIWAIDNSNRLKFIRPTYFKNAKGAILAFDPNIKAQSEKVKEIYQEIIKSVGNIPAIFWYEPLNGEIGDITKIDVYKEIISLGKNCVFYQIKKINDNLLKLSFSAAIESFESNNHITLPYKTDIKYLTPTSDDVQKMIEDDPGFLNQLEELIAKNRNRDLIETSISEINEEMIKRFCTSPQSNESKNIEYKLKYNFKNPKIPNEFRADILQFINGAGGILIIGIDDYKKVIGLNLSEKEMDNLQLQLSEYLENFIDPPLGLDLYEFTYFPLENSNYIFIIKIEPSNTFHALNTNNRESDKPKRYSFYRRGNGKKVNISMSCVIDILKQKLK